MTAEEAKKDLFYWFGIACYEAQAYEYEIKRLLFFNGLLRKMDLAHHPDLLPLIESKATLGKLSAVLKQYVANPALVEPTLRDCLKKRNRLIHGYFVEHQNELNSLEGVSAITKELRAIAELFQAQILDIQLASESILCELHMQETEEWVLAQASHGNKEGLPDD